MRIALLPNLTREKTIEVTYAICNQLDLYNVEYSLLIANKSFFNISNAKFMESEEMLNWCDTVIAIGGDGSFMNAAKKAVKYNKPILCINAGNLAFMAGLENNELELLKNLIDGNYAMDKRMMLDVRVMRDGKLLTRDFCINDVVLARGTKIKMAQINIDCDGNRINSYRADGVIIATPTGSTAYSLATGGPVVDPTIESIILTPIATHSLFARSIIFRPDNELVLYPEKSSNYDELFLSCDGEESFIIQNDDKIVIRKSKKSAGFIRIKNDDFFNILKIKLADRRV